MSFAVWLYRKLQEEHALKTKFEVFRFVWVAQQCTFSSQNHEQKKGGKPEGACLCPKSKTTN
jgi:hypothetical protein